MWDCEHCGCQAIAGSLEDCPVCWKPKGSAAVLAVEETPAESTEVPAGNGTSDDKKGW